MMPGTKIAVVCLLIFAWGMRVAFAETSEPAYVFVSGLAETSQVNIYNMGLDGTISLRSSFDYDSYRGQMADLWDAYFSPKGNYCLLGDWSHRNGMFFSIDSSYNFHFIKEINGGCKGCGFTQDGEYCFNSTGFDCPDWEAKPQIRIFKVNGGSFDLVKTQDVLSSATFSNDVFCTANDEVIASTYNAVFDPPSPKGIVMYQFNRQTESLQLKSYSKTNDCIIMADATADRKVIAYSEGNHIGSLVRQADNSYLNLPEYWRHEWWDASGAYGIRLSKDGEYAVALIADNDNQWPTSAGVVLFKVKPTGELEYQSIAHRYLSASIDFTPDGKYCVIGEGYIPGTFEVMRINRETNTLDHVSQFTLPNACIGFIRFLPQVRPKTAVGEKGWAMYGEEADESGRE